MSELAVVSGSPVIIYTLVTFGRCFPRVDTHRHGAGDLSADRHLAVAVEQLLDFLLTLLFQPAPKGVHQLLGLVQ